jgi:uncharacterized protein YigA (DUF484 family)
VTRSEGTDPKVRKRGPAKAPADPSAEAAIVAYLEANPDFVARHPALLRALTPPAADHGRGVIDFQRYMVSRLQSDVDLLAGENNALVQTARSNSQSQSRIHNAVLALIGARSLGELIEILTSDLAVMLDVDVIAMTVEATGNEVPCVAASGIRIVEQGSVAKWLGRRDVVLRSAIAGDPAIYGPAAGLIRSEALLKLSVSARTPVGMLAFGSREKDLFQEGQGTELISFLGAVIERLIRAWLDLPS